jgi:hypothetical protein
LCEYGGIILQLTKMHMTHLTYLCYV